MSSLLALLDARRCPAPAVSFPDEACSYAELAEASLRAAQRLRAAGVGPGDRVGILARVASVEYVALGLGALRLAAIYVPLNARNKAHELAYAASHAGLSILFITDEYEALVAEAELPDDCRLVVLGADPDFEAGDVPEDEVHALQARVSPEDPALLLYTSGTTANPKGCVISHRALLAAGRNSTERLQLTEKDRFWTALAMFHVGGWQVLAAAFTSGGCASHVGFFDAETALLQLARERVTVAFAAFELIWMPILDHPRFPEQDLSALRIVMNVGVPERLGRMQAKLPTAVQVSCLGMTESTGSMCIGETTDSLLSRTTTSGRPLTGMELRIVDLKTAEDCPTGVAGELLFRGDSAFSGYYRDPENTAATIDAEGWIRTGDIVRAEPDGTFAFVGRLKDMLKVGGENVSAAEIEGYLLTHPAVDVAAVVAAPDARYGEVAAAYVRLAPGAEASEEELIDYCVGQIATFKVPRYVRFVDEFPLTPTAKIQKVTLRERIALELRAAGVSEAPKISTRAAHA
jgi:fatty-acyl-CoA synthase